MEEVSYADEFLTIYGTLVNEYTRKDRRKKYNLTEAELTKLLESFEKFVIERSGSGEVPFQKV